MRCRYLRKKIKLESVLLIFLRITTQHRLEIEVYHQYNYVGVNKEREWRLSVVNSQIRVHQTTRAKPA